MYVITNTFYKVSMIVASVNVIFVVMKGPNLISLITIGASKT